MSRLTIDIASQQHQSPKALAALQDKTIKQYALERLFSDDAQAKANLFWLQIVDLTDRRRLSCSL